MSKRDFYEYKTCLREGREGRHTHPNAHMSTTTAVTRCCRHTGTENRPDTRSRTNTITDAQTPANGHIRKAGLYGAAEIPTEACRADNALFVHPPHQQRSL